MVSHRSTDSTNTMKTTRRIEITVETHSRIVVRRIAGNVPPGCDRNPDGASATEVGVALQSGALRPTGPPIEACLVQTEGRRFLCLKYPLNSIEEK